MRLSPLLLVLAITIALAGFYIVYKSSTPEGREATTPSIQTTAPATATSTATSTTSTPTATVTTPATREEYIIRIYADRTLQKPLEEIMQEFIRDKCPSCKVAYVYGSSGYALSRLELDGGGDLYVADDIHFPRIGVEKGLLVNNTLVTVGYVRLSLLVKKGNPKNITSLMDALTREGITVAMGNPEHVSAGVLAWSFFKEKNLTTLVEKLVREGKVRFAPSASEVAAQVRAGISDAGITFHIYAVQYPEELEEVPDKILEAPVVVALPANHGPLARQVYEYVVSRAEVFWKHGVIPAGKS